MNHSKLNETLIASFGLEAVKDWCVINAYAYMIIGRSDDDIEALKQAQRYLGEVIELNESEKEDLESEESQPEPEPKKEPEAPKPEPKEQPKPKERKPAAAAPHSAIDHGKIIALCKAGWTATRIADEMGCSVQTVCNHINRERDQGTL